MEKSSSIKEIGKALMLFHVKVDKIKKDSTNPFYKSKYASLSTILEAIQSPLEESGLTFTQFPDGDCLNTVLIHPDSGEFMQACYNIHPLKSDPQAIGSAITYARRYALSAILGLNVDEDDDANAATAKQSEKTQNNGAMNPNEKAVETDARPWLSEKQFNQALERINGGETGVYEKLNVAFKMKKDYREKIKPVTV